jgi:hypothetical protein
MMAKEKPFAGEHFIFPDSCSLGHVPWDTRLQTSFVAEAHCETRNSTEQNCPRFLSVRNLLPPLPFYFDVLTF